MVQFIVNGIDRDLGTYNSGSGSLLAPFAGRSLTLVQQPGRALHADIKKIIGDALNYIEAHCANKPCNRYFLSLNNRNPISLSDILSKTELQFFRLMPLRYMELSAEEVLRGLNALPAALTFAFDSNSAQIGINELTFGRHDMKGILLHELAHVAGAPGRRERPKSIAAEIALVKCGLIKAKDLNEEDWG